MKKIGFVDYYISEWHANNYPVWIKELDCGYKVTHAWAELGVSPVDRRTTEQWCDKFGYDYEKLKTLGTFKIEAEIQKFKAFSYGCYAYTKTDDELVIKASGCNKDQLPQDDSIYELYNLPTGTRKLPRFNPETTTCEVDGVVYISEGSYYEYETKSSAETDFNYILTLMGVDL